MYSLQGTMRTTPPLTNTIESINISTADIRVFDGQRRAVGGHQHSGEKLQKSVVDFTHKRRLDIPTPPSRAVLDPEAAKEVDYQNRDDRYNQIHSNKFDDFLISIALVNNITHKKGSTISREPVQLLFPSKYRCCRPHRVSFSVQQPLAFASFLNTFHIIHFIQFLPFLSSQHNGIKALDQ